MGFTFDSPISVSYSAADKAHKRKPRGIPLPPSKSKPKSDSLLKGLRRSFTRSNPHASPISLGSQGQRRHSSYEAPPLVFQHLPPRNRCLTPSPDGAQSLPCSKTDGQTQSPLFKLPEEILLLIYKEVIGNRLLHIVRRQQDLGHVLCKGSGDPDDCIENQCRGIKSPTGPYTETGPGSGDIIQLLQTCRKM
jgi:hypothetical protein